MQDDDSTTRTRMLRRLHHVPRWAIVPVLRRQSVAEHTFGVMVAAEWLMDNHVSVSNMERMAVLRCCMLHDAYESITGDIPSPWQKRIKSKVPVPSFIEGMSEKVRWVSSIADSLEALAFLYEEVRMGNSTVKPIQGYISDKLVEDWKRNDEYTQGLGAHNLITRWYCVIDPSNHPGMLYV